MILRLVVRVTENDHEASAAHPIHLIHQVAHPLLPCQMITPKVAYKMETHSSAGAPAGVGSLAMKQ